MLHGRWRRPTRPSTFDLLLPARRSLSLLPPHARIYELGPRDGLQNEKVHVPTDAKVHFVDLLSRTGVHAVETTSFVSPRWVPQMSDHREVLQRIEQMESVSYPVLVPNMQGFEAAVAAGARIVAVMTAPSTTFARKNLNCTVDETVERAVAIAEAAEAKGLACRGYISCALGCPFEGEMEPAQVAPLAEALHRAGCYEVCLADTIGTGTAGSMDKLLKHVSSIVPIEKLAVHCHDTYGQALANILAALMHGVAVVDSSVAGLGGCPFAPGAAGNVATEDVVYMLNGLGVESGVSFERVVQAGDYIVEVLGRRSASRAALATAANRASAARIVV
eukprot:CAMPEP_0119353654 /NCGR_PEP_ID=MMETSP1334-20130426/2760_1 /TAXON_ID=127549 /ORGANISM="Calcidiscus leptoporus, Strain RCC1130" /LENGTH=333 /DNA_ID=CAMNT_0007366989 /DNA_START=35 /DNA_END=1036 /DNA_ORIENTATION=+